MPKTTRAARLHAHGKPLQINEIELPAPGKGALVQVNWQQLYRKSLRVLGYGGLGLTQAERRAGLTHTLEALATGQMRIPVDRVLALDDVNEALALLAGRQVTGKVMLDLR